MLIIATGAKIAPEETEGMKGAEWQKSVFDFYTFEGSLALRNKLRDWEGGKLVVHITEMPIKCPVAPLEFAFLADSFFKHKHMRNKVEITYVTPLSWRIYQTKMYRGTRIFTGGKSAAMLSSKLYDHKITFIPCRNNWVNKLKYQ